MGSKLYTLGGSKLDEKEKERLDKEILETHERREKDFAEKHKRNTEQHTVEAVDLYNKELLNIGKEVEGLVMPKGTVLMRLFRAPRVLASGLYLPSTETAISEDTGKLKLVKKDDISDIKYLSRGVVVAVGDGCNEHLKAGTVVDLYMRSYNSIMQYWSPLNRMETDPKVPENYFTVPENYINFIWTTYQL